MNLTTVVNSCWGRARVNSKTNKNELMELRMAQTFHLRKEMQMSNGRKLSRNNYTSILIVICSWNIDEIYCQLFICLLIPDANRNLINKVDMTNRCEALKEVMSLNYVYNIKIFITKHFHIKYPRYFRSFEMFHIWYFSYCKCDRY